MHMMEEENKLQGIFEGVTVRQLEVVRGDSSQAIEEKMQAMNIKVDDRCLLEESPFKKPKQSKEN